MPEGKKNTAPVPSPVRDEDGYSAKTHLHQPVQETATVAATALLADVGFLHQICFSWTRQPENRSLEPAFRQ